MAKLDSPLRYPGGKTSLSRLLGDVILRNGLGDCVYAEPYAGGAGAALSLLYAEKVSRILINDADWRIYCFWWGVLNRNEQFLDLLSKTRVSMAEWYRQREIYRSPARHGKLKVGFATFFLNRCNRSGILVNGGPIGGTDQVGRWKLNARYNKASLAHRLKRVSLYKDRINLSNLDALDFLKADVARQARKADVLVYLDPPYYGKGRRLYMNYYEHADHRRLAMFLKSSKPYWWLMSYDDVPEIRQLYRDFSLRPFDLAYTAYNQRAGREVLIHNGELSLPRQLATILSA